jgi:uncharacterized protein (DUF885 family)
MTLQELSDRFWAARCEYAPTIATAYGVHDFDDRLRRFDDGWLGELADRFRAIAKETGSLDVSGMTTQERITRDLLVYEATNYADEIGRRYLVAPIDPFLGPHTRLLTDTRQNTVSSPDQAGMLLRRYEQVPEYLAGALEFHRANIAAGMTPARAPVERVLSQVDGYLDSPLEGDPFLALRVPGEASNWSERATALVTDVIRPAFDDYRQGLREHVIPKARPDDKCGLVWMNGGEETYATLLRKYTQLEISPQQIHDTGQEWATEINAAEWVEIGSRAFAASSKEEVFDRLHNDPTLRFTSEDEMLDHARSAIDRAWAAVDDWFGAKPATPCTVVPVPPAQAPAMPPAYYMMPPIDGSRPGTYFLNTYRPEERDRFEYESIHFHEAVPGHHFDRSLAAELDGIPTFRRYTQVYAHTEGWGLYAERLADEMGLYSSDVDRLGMVSADAWRAGRLVTDTGIHALGWNRQQAIDFLAEWTPIGRLTIEQEVDRYIGMAGQAVSYKIGQLEILRLRRLAEERLGDRFDIKGFHDQMLTHGAMPLPSLSETVEEWISTVA